MMRPAALAPWLALAMAVATASCRVPDPGASQTLHGEVGYLDFEFASGFAADNILDDELWAVTLHKVEPNPGMEPWESGAYPSSYPYVSFTLAKLSAAQEYEVSTFGTSSSTRPGKVLLGWTSLSTGVSFDRGTLAISTIDRANNIISGTITASTVEPGSSLSGSFTIPIDPASR